MDIEADPFGSAEAFAALGGGGGSPGQPQAPAGRSVQSRLQPGADAGSATDAAAAPPATEADAGRVGWRLRLMDPEVVIAVEPGTGVLLGRDPTSPICDHPSVSQYTSSQHARVWVDPADPAVAFISDSSTNGTWLSGSRLLAGVRNVLRPGDVIRLANEHPVVIEVLG